MGFGWVLGDHPPSLLAEGREPQWFRSGLVRHRAFGADGSSAGPAWLLRPWARWFICADPDRTVWIPGSSCFKERCTVRTPEMNVDRVTGFLFFCFLGKTWILLCMYLLVFFFPCLFFKCNVTYYEVHPLKYTVYWFLVYSLVSLFASLSKLI